MEPKSELVRRSMKIVKNRAGSTINDRADSLLIHENTALNERSYSRKGLLNGALVDSEGMHMEERRSGTVAAVGIIVDAGERHSDDHLLFFVSVPCTYYYKHQGSQSQ